MRGFLFVIFSLLLNTAVSVGQPITFHGQPSTRKGIDISKQTTFYEDQSDDTLNRISDICTQKFLPIVSNWNPTLNDFAKATKISWKRFEIANIHASDTVHLWYNAGIHATLSLYDDNGKLIGKGGLFAQSYGHAGTIAITIPPLSHKWYYVRVIDYVRVFAYESDLLYTPQGLDAHMAHEALLIKWLLVAMSMIAGSLLLMGLYTLFQYYFNRDAAYLYYTFYATVSFAWIVKIADYRLSLGLAPNTLPELTHPCLASLSFSVSFFTRCFW